jgi:ribosomal protein S18 acetylase RimI-like enzyme
MNSLKTIRILSENDCADIAQIHLLAFPESALTRLGYEAVKRYYEWLFTGPYDGLAAGVFSDARLVGFVFAGYYRGSLSHFVSRNRSFLFTRILTHPWLAFNSIFLDRIKLALHVLQPKKVKGQSPQPPPNKYFGILAIAVDPGLQKSGIGKLIMDFTEKAALERGYTKIHLTVHPTNINAVRFYEKIGWQRVLTQAPWKGAMMKEISE